VLGEGVGRAGEQGHARARAREQARRGKPDAARRAGDERGAPGERAGGAAVGGRGQ
jgi:hypothetical protein